MFLPLFLLALLHLSSGCDQNCAYCRDSGSSDSVCLACSDGFSPVEGGGCEAESTLPNCGRYDSSLNCLACRPTFEPIWNSCQRTFAGCLVFRGTCLQCLPGAVLSPSGSCSIQYLNCIAISSQGACTACQPRYVLKNGKCNYQSSSCAFLDKNTGLCTQCNSSNVLLGTSCLPAAWVAANRNCYLAEQSAGNATCRYCKQGYGVYFGSCLPFARIANLTALPGNCSLPEFLEANQPDCANGSAGLGNCQLVDFGRGGCTFCSAGYDLVNGSCQSIAEGFCLNASGRSCRGCKQGFYLRGGVCAPFPPYCVAFASACSGCQPGFQLVGGQCFDPNCQTANPVTRACQICLANYRVNPFGVCKFLDPNCLRFNESLDCVGCAKGYSMRASLQYCVYQDLNCLAFDNGTGGCNMCRPFYAYNDQVQLCVPLPENCQAADRSGRCSSCMAGYNLVSNYTCLFIPALPNCQMVSKDDYSRCVLCNNGSYADPLGACRALPTFCAVYDSGSGQCQQCRDNGLMRGGSCVDKNCQIFDEEGGCLACIASYQFSSFGQCVFSPRDPNCKEFLFGICKSCVERYFFDSSFLCVAVSPLCKTYDSNSGGCLSCYEGYQLSANGGCYLNIYDSVVGNNDVLSLSCKRYNANGQCLQCYFGYRAIPLGNSSEVVECVQSAQQSRNSYCISQDATGRCLECVYRMYVNASGACAGIDENCNEYNQSTGACISCYPGYANTPNNGSSRCVILVDADPNCQSRGNSSVCLKCYSGFYFSAESLKCLQVNQLCATFNATTGDCLSCYDGYALSQGNCKINNASPPSPSPSPSTSPSTPSSCLQFTGGKCSSCDWGFALMNGSCVQRDLNCQVFAGPNSLSCSTCYSGYKPFGAGQSRCVLATLVVEHCLKYSAAVECVLCESGYVLARSSDSSPPYTCNLIDQNCAVFNSTSASCAQCMEGAVLQGSSCVTPTYGVDSNCVFYANKVCTACRKGYSLTGYLCSPN